MNSANGNQKELFKIINKVFHKNSDPPLPTHNLVKELTNKFADFFVSKINNIRIKLERCGDTFVLNNEHVVHDLRVDRMKYIHVKKICQ